MRHKKTGIWSFDNDAAIVGLPRICITQVSGLVHIERWEGVAIDKASPEH